MKTSIAFLLATVVLAVQGSTLDSRRNRGGQQGFGQGNNGGNQNAGNNTNTGGGNVAANNGGNNNGGNGNVDPQESLTLDPSVICTACTDDGQNPPVDQQSPSLTSSNNFLNFCQGKTLTNGQQLVQGSCNGVVLGDIIPSSNMPGAKITFPTNGGTFAANQQFTFTMNIKNMITGNFVNANANYYGAPQQLQGGVVVGHSHITVQKMDAIDQTTPLDPQVFAFFKGINTKDNNGVLSVDVTDGLPAGVYRFCTMNTNANHTPVMVAIAQHGSLDDCIYATATDGGNNNGGNNGGNNNGGNTANASTSAAVADASSTDAAASTTDAAAASTTAAAAATSSAATGSGRNNGGQGRQGQGNGRGGRGRGGRGRGGRGRHPH